MPKVIMNMPDFALDFQCERAKCKDKCCNRFDIIYFSKESYNTLITCNNTELQTIAKKNLKINEASNTKYDYAFLKPEGKCKFLDKNGNCLIKDLLGEKYLGFPCASYPRAYVNMCGELDACALSSCPQMLKKMLDQESGIKFTKIQRNLSKDNPGQKYTDIYNKYASFIPELKRMAINLLQNRNFTIEKRLLLLTTFYNHLDQLFDVKDPKCAEFIKLYSSKLSDIKYASIFKNFKSSFKEQLVLGYLLFETMLRSNYNDEIDHLLDFIAELADGVDVKDMQDITQKYKAAYENYYIPFEEKYGYMIENILVNECFSNGIPFLYFNKMSDSALFLTVYFSMIRYLICMNSIKKQSKPSHDEVFTLIYAIAKRFEPTEHYYENGYNGVLTKVKLILVFEIIKNFKLKPISLINGLLGERKEDDESINTIKNEDERK